MVDAGIGRLLISSLHQGIADVSPNRLEFYENWLSPTGMRDGRIGLAPLGAVLSFVIAKNPQPTSRSSRVPDATPPIGRSRTCRRFAVGTCDGCR
jgi:hypothetical protein